MPISAGQSNFTAGEWSPFALSRTDNNKYAAACKTMRNFFPHAHGPASNRPGFPYVATVKNSTKDYRIYPFTFSVVQGYLLVFGDLNLRFIMDGGLITSPKAITGAANNGSGLIRITSAAHGFQTGNTVTVSGVGGVPAANGTWIITVITVNTYDLVASTFAGAYTSGGIGEAIVEIATPYAHTDLGLLKFEQSADTLEIRHPSYDRRKLTRTSHYLWTITTIVAGSTLLPPTAVTASGGTGSVYVVTSALDDGTESVQSVGTASASGNTLTWTPPVVVPDLYKVYKLVNGIGGYIGQTNTASYVIDSTAPDLTISPPVAQNPFNGSGNWPGCCAYFQQRLYEGRTDNNPQTIEGSVVGEFHNSNFSIPTQDDDAISITLNSQQVNEIKWMLEANNLVIGTAGAEWLLSPGSNGSAVTQKNYTIVKQSRWGCCDIPPVVVGHDVLFLEASRKKVRDLFYSIVVGGVNGGYDANDLSILSDHLFVNYGIKQWAYQQHPDSIVWGVRDDGVLLGLTFLKEHQIFGWHRHDTDGLFLDVAVVGNTDGTKDLYVLVDRDGTKMIEIASVRNNDQEHDVEDDIFLDSCISYDGAVSHTLAFTAGDPTVSGNTCTCTASGSTFVLGDVGRFITYRYKTYPTPQEITATPAIQDPAKIPTWHTGYLKITGYTSATVVTVLVINPFTDNSTLASGSWAMTVKQMSGADHLNGVSCVALANGAVIRDLVPSSGIVTFPNPVSKVHLGRAYTCDLAIPSPDYPTRTGTVQDKIRTVIQVVLKLINTRALWIGADDQHLFEYAFRKDEIPNEPTNLFNGTTDPIGIGPGSELRSASVFMRVTDPLPITVQAVYPRIEDGSN